MQEDHNCSILTKILFLTEVIPSIEIQVVIRAVYIYKSPPGEKWRHYRRGRCDRFFWISSNF